VPPQHSTGCPAEAEHFQAQGRRLIAPGLAEPSAKRQLAKESESAAAAVVVAVEEEEKEEEEVVVVVVVVNSRLAYLQPQRHSHTASTYPSSMLPRPVPPAALFSSANTSETRPHPEKRLLETHRERSFLGMV
jgi:hypothetical protein